MTTVKGDFLRESASKSTASFLAESLHSIDASSHLCKRPCPSVRWLVGPSVGPSVGNVFVKIDEKWPFMVYLLCHLFAQKYWFPLILTKASRPRTDGRADKASYRDARTHLKMDAATFCERKWSWERAYPEKSRITNSIFFSHSRDGGFSSFSW